MAATLWILIAMAGAAAANSCTHHSSTGDVINVSSGYCTWSSTAATASKIWVSVGVETADNDNFHVQVGYTCVLHPAGNTCPQSSTVRLDTVGGSIAWQGTVAMPNIPGCAGYVAMICDNVIDDCNFRLEIDICSSSDPVKPDWPELISPDRYLYSEAETIPAYGGTCFSHFDPTRFANTTYSIDVRSTNQDSFSVDVLFRCANVGVCSDDNQEVVKSYKPDGGVVYVRSLTVNFPVKYINGLHISAWTCVPQVFVHCNNLFSSCQLSTSIAMVSLPGDVDPTPKLGERFSTDFSLPMRTAIIEPSANAEGDGQGQGHEQPAADAPQHSRPQVVSGADPSLLEEAVPNGRALE